jgi:squalene cyclase
MPIDFDRAVAYAREHGDEFDQARLDELLDGQGSLSHDQAQRFFSGQRKDGGWAPFWAPDSSSLDATCYRLAQAETIAPYHPAFQRAVAFLATRQRPDGSFEEDESVRDLAPPWAKPGELAPRLYLTANCGWWLDRGSGYFVGKDKTHAEAWRTAARRAGAYLERHLAPDGSLPSFLHAHWLAAALWIRLNWDRRPDLPEPTRRVLDYLATRMTDAVPASSLAWMLTTLGPIMQGEHPLIERATALLIAQQRPDGSWASEDGPERDPYVIIEALRALIQWAAI